MVNMITERRLQWLGHMFGMNNQHIQRASSAVGRFQTLRGDQVDANWMGWQLRLTKDGTQLGRSGGRQRTLEIFCCDQMPPPGCGLSQGSGTSYIAATAEHSK